MNVIQVRVVGGWFPHTASARSAVKRDVPFFGNKINIIQGLSSIFILAPLSTPVRQPVKPVCGTHLKVNLKKGYQKHIAFEMI